MSTPLLIKNTLYSACGRYYKWTSSLCPCPLWFSLLAPSLVVRLQNLLLQLNFARDSDLSPYRIFMCYCVIHFPTFTNIIITRALLSPYFAYECISICTMGCYIQVTPQSSFFLSCTLCNVYGDRGGDKYDTVEDKWMPIRMEEEDYVAQILVVI